MRNYWIIVLILLIIVIINYKYDNNTVANNNIINKITTKYANDIAVTLPIKYVNIIGNKDDYFYTFRWSLDNNQVTYSSFEPYIFKIKIIKSNSDVITQTQIINQEQTNLVPTTNQIDTRNEFDLIYRTSEVGTDKSYKDFIKEIIINKINQTDDLSGSYIQIFTSSKEQGIQTLVAQSEIIMGGNNILKILYDLSSNNISYYDINSNSTKNILPVYKANPNNSNYVLGGNLLAPSTNTYPAPTTTLTTSNSTLMCPVNTYIDKLNLDYTLTSGTNQTNLYITGIRLNCKNINTNIIETQQVSASVNLGFGGNIIRNGSMNFDVSNCNISSTNQMCGIKGVLNYYDGTSGFPLSFTKFQSYDGTLSSALADLILTNPSTMNYSFSCPNNKRLVGMNYQTVNKIVPITNENSNRISRCQFLCGEFLPDFI
jgi:hypothetical protein